MDIKLNWYALLYCIISDCKSVQKALLKFELSDLQESGDVKEKTRNR